MAILTPDGIRKRLFKLPDGTPLNVEVAIDRPAPHRVRHEGIIVTPSSSALEISVTKSQLDDLLRACELGQSALQSLPETPVSAAGINFRYLLPEIPDELIELTEMRLADAFSDAGFSIIERYIRHTLSLEPGVINVELALGQNNSGTVALNFHFDSQDPSELREWIERAAEFHAKTLTILQLLNISPQEGEDSHV